VDRFEWGNERGEIKRGRPGEREREREREREAAREEAIERRRGEIKILNSASRQSFFDVDNKKKAATTNELHLNH
jgi:hypothetical protein